MVHALINARRLLRPHGVLVDFRSDRFSSHRARHDQLYCATGTRWRYAGRLKINKPLADFRAADRAIRDVLRRGLFRLEVAEPVEMRSYYGGLAHLDKAIAENPYGKLDTATRHRLAVLSHRYPRSGIVAVARGRLTVLVKT
jgi:hypothetical protein